MATPTPNTTERKLSKLEGLKEQSDFLREPVATEILEDTTHFSQAGLQILKFHGSYQQDNRDNRVKGQEKDYQMMIRTRNPGGFIPAQLYLTLDRLASEYGNETLRITTRQGFQLHGILKKNLKATIGAIVQNLGSTLGACGDLNRNVMAPPAPFKNRPEYGLAWKYADRIANLLTPQSGAYYEIWLDGEKAISAEEDPDVKAARQRNGNGTIFKDKEEPIYGENYMPRKFKSCITVPGDNSVDLYSQDLSLVLISNEQGDVQGFNILAGGGLARTHNKEETFPRLADELGYVDHADIYDLVKAIVATQRDYGDRHNRRHARLKYLLHDWGVEKFRSIVEGYFGKSLQPYQPLPEWRYEDYLGWQEQGDGKLFLGLWVQNGRIADYGDWKLRSALRSIIETFNLPMRLTPHQNLLIYDIDPSDRQTINGILRDAGVQSLEGLDSLKRLSMACPALPTCGLAIAESERAIPDILDRIRKLLVRVGLPKEEFVIRMTGCPNGCARPYIAELGFVGRAPNVYQMWLGADANQTRLAQVYRDRVAADEIEQVLEPLFVYFKQERKPGERFGDFCDRIGMEGLQEFSDNYDPSTLKPKRQERHRIRIYDDVYDRLKEESLRSGKPMLDLASEALNAYLTGNRQDT